MRRRAPGILRQILEVRLAQRTAAQTRHRQAASTLQTLEARRAESARALDEEETAWSQAVASPALGWSVARAWSLAIAARAAALQRLSADVRAAEDERARAAASWRDAQAREDVASTLTQSAARDAARRADERAQGEAADRTAQRRARR